MKLVDVLQQTEVWVDGAQHTHHLDHMDPDHRASLIPLLRGCALALGRRCGLDTPEPDTALAEAWLESTPLMRRLVQLEQERPRRGVSP